MPSCIIAYLLGAFPRNLPRTGISRLFYHISLLVLCGDFIPMSTFLGGKTPPNLGRSLRDFRDLSMQQQSSFQLATVLRERLIHDM